MDIDSAFRGQGYELVSDFLAKGDDEYKVGIASGDLVNNVGGVYVFGFEKIDIIFLGPVGDWCRSWFSATAGGMGWGGDYQREFVSGAFEGIEAIDTKLSTTEEYYVHIV